MIRQTIYKAIAIILASLIGFNALGVDLSLHFCSGQFSSISLTSTSNSCHNKALSKICGGKDVIGISAEKPDAECCQNKSMELDPSDDWQSATNFDVALDIDIDWVCAVSVAPKVDVETFDVALFQKYRPPLIPLDAITRFQVYLL